MLARMAERPTFCIHVSFARLVFRQGLNVPMGSGCHQFGCCVCECREWVYVEDGI